MADVTIKQKTLHDCEKYVGQLTVLVQELDGSFSNLLQVTNYLYLLTGYYGYWIIYYIL